MKFSDLEDGENRLERFKRELKTDLERERQERRYERSKQLADRLPWIVVGAAGWIFFLAVLVATAHK